ncbi:MAG TPA: glycosyl hydrolase family 18 protein [Candidatus Limnocylindrales bacterium]
MSLPTPSSLARHPGSLTTRCLAIAAAVLLVGWTIPAAPLRAADLAGAAAPTADTGAPGAIQPTIQYDEAMAHAGDKIAFAPGDRVSVPFKPRAGDHWAVGGLAPRTLPAGRMTGGAMRTRDAPRLHGRQSGPSSPSTGAPVGAADVPYTSPFTAPHGDLAAAVDPGGLKREVFGFLPYWELSDPSTRYDWEKLSTIAYFGVGAAGNGTLQKQNSDGSTTVGWSGWTSAKMTGVINAAHASGARVVLTVQSFAWTSAGVARQKALLGSASARANLARQIAAAIRDRGADGVNLDFEPIVSTYGDEFTALVRSVRAELNRMAPGYQLTFDTTGWIGNYPIEAATASGGADAVMVMGYDYRSGSSNPVGSVAPIGGSGYDVGDTVAAYIQRLPPSKIILGVPYYGRVWSTATATVHARNISGAKYGASTTVVYGTALDYTAAHGRHWDPVDGVAWTQYRRQNCTAAYGCVNPVRQIYFDDAQALGLKYDLVNRANLRGVGIWALGYDGSHPELYQALKAKFITDTIPPRITASSISSAFISPNGDGRLDTTTVRVSVTGLLRYGWIVQPFAGGIAGKAVRSGSLVGKNVVFTWDGRNDAGSPAADGPYRITVWTADASNNRASVQKIVTVDRRPAKVSLSMSAGFLSPNGDGHNDTVTLGMRADEAFGGTARLIDRNGATVRKWAFVPSTAQSWVWNGRNTAGALVPDDRYTLLVTGRDRASTSTTSQATVRVDGTIRYVTWSRSSFVPKSGQKARVAFALRRHATVTISIYRGSTLIRRIWTNRALAAGAYGWTWDGRSAAGALVAPGTYRALVTASTWIGSSTFTRNIIVKAP